jgi:hypothetical protein
MFAIKKSLSSFNSQSSSVKEIVLIFFVEHLT